MSKLCRVDEKTESQLFAAKNQWEGSIWDTRASETNLNKITNRWTGFPSDDQRDEGKQNKAANRNLPTFSTTSVFVYTRRQESF